MRWLQSSVNQKDREVPQQVEITTKKGKRTLELDEMWSFVQNKQRKVWYGLAIDQKTGEMAGVYLGDRLEAAAKQLWNSLSAVYRQCAVCYTDFSEAYYAAPPQKDINLSVKIPVKPIVSKG